MVQEPLERYLRGNSVCLASPFSKKKQMEIISSLLKHLLLPTALNLSQQDYVCE